MRKPALALGLVCVMSCCLFAEGNSEITDIRELFDRYASKLRLVDQITGDALKLVERPVLNWSNPERRTPAGGLFLWTKSGRPKVAMCIYPSGGGRFEMEFQSLSLGGLTMHRDEELVWNPQVAGGEWKDLETKYEVGKSASLRLSQMRRLASRFAARLTFDNQADRLLRMQSTPVFRYPPKELESNVIDGAAFSFVQGTDPEVLLLIEATTDGGSEPKWRYMLARMTIVRSIVSLDKQDVWRTEWGRRGIESTYQVVAGR